MVDPFWLVIFYDVDVMKTRQHCNEQPLRLLVVGAVDHSRDSLVAFLQLQDCLEVVGETAVSAKALELARQLEPDVVIMDVSLPDMDGFAATQQMLALEAAPAIVLLAVHYRARDSLRAEEAGAAAYIEKSAGVDVILDTLQALSETQTRRKSHV